MNTDIDAPTVIHVFKEGKGNSWYPLGLDVMLTGAAGQDKNTTIIEDGNQISIMVNNKELNGTNLNILIMPKSNQSNKIEFIEEDL